MSGAIGSLLSRAAWCSMNASLPKHATRLLSLGNQTAVGSGRINLRFRSFTAGKDGRHSLVGTPTAMQSPQIFPGYWKTTPLRTSTCTSARSIEQNTDAFQGLRSPPPAGERVLLHSCCAPCSGAMIEEMVQKYALDVTIFFYNPNIHPRKEYELRKDENCRFAEKLGVPFVDVDYDVDDWFARAKGMEDMPERGRRCTMCFDMRFDRTALYAYEHDFPVFTTTNATSRWKDQDQVNGSGLRAAAKYAGVDYWVYDWQTDDMTNRKYQINAENTFYKQQYCGCAYSLRDSNLWRLEQGMDPIKVGGDYWYTDPVADAAEESREVVENFFDEYEYRNQIRRPARQKKTASAEKESH